MSSASSPREREYLFIDGGCLRATVAGISQQITENPDELQPYLRDIAGGADKVFLYDAISAQNYGESLAAYEERVQGEHEKFDAIRALDRYHVALGEIKGRPGNRRQKRVDVRLAVDMLTHTFRGNMHKATLLAGDDDFVPLVEALVREGMNVTIWHPPKASSELLAAADNRRPFDFTSCYQSLTRDGASSAFQHGGSGSGSSGPTDYDAIWSEDSDTYAVAWRSDELTLWWQSGDYWSYERFRCPGSPLKLAVTAFDLINGRNLMTRAKPHWPALET